MRGTPTSLSYLGYSWPCTACLDPRKKNWRKRRPSLLEKAPLWGCRRTLKPGHRDNIPFDAIYATGVQSTRRLLMLVTEGAKLQTLLGVDTRSSFATRELV